jgi:predicted lipoprotein with Yx(FWY)xxD motif
MSRRNYLSTARLWRPGLSIAIAISGFATAALVGVAIAKTFTLKVEKNAKVINQQNVTKHENILTFHGSAVYMLTGDNKHHPECVSSTCLQTWPPVTVTSSKKLSKAPGISGRLGVWRHKGLGHMINQVTLGGHPLYKFSGDKANGVATGEGIAFGPTEVWHAFSVAASKATSTPGSPGTSTSTSSATSSSTSTTTSVWG